MSASGAVSLFELAEKANADFVKLFVLSVDWMTTGYSLVLLQAFITPLVVNTEKAFDEILKLPVTSVFPPNELVPATLNFDVPIVPILSLSDKKVFPWTWSVVDGVAVPIPSQLVSSSKIKLGLVCS